MNKKWLMIQVINRHSNIKALEYYARYVMWHVTVQHQRIFISNFFSPILEKLYVLSQSLVSRRGSVPFFLFFWYFVFKVCVCVCVKWYKIRTDTVLFHPRNPSSLHSKDLKTSYRREGALWLFLQALHRPVRYEFCPRDPILQDPLPRCTELSIPFDHN